MTQILDNFNLNPANCWDGFLFHLNSKKPIKITLISIKISSRNIKPKVYYQENYDHNSKEDKWKEIPYTLKDGSNNTMVFENFIIPDQSNSSICILHPNVWFLDGSMMNVPNENDHFTLGKGWPMYTQNKVFSKVLYHFIGRIETQIYNQVYLNIANMKKARDINFIFI